MKYITKYILLFLIGLTLLHCDDIIDLTDITDENITVLAPTDGVTLDKPNVIFSWNNIDGAEDYHLQIATPNFENATSIVLDSTITATTLTQTLETGNYQWRVSAKNTNYQTTYSTQNLTITLGDAADILVENHFQHL